MNLKYSRMEIIIVQVYVPYSQRSTWIVIFEHQQKDFQYFIS